MEAKQVIPARLTPEVIKHIQKISEKNRWSRSLTIQVLLEEALEKRKGGKE